MGAIFSKDSQWKPVPSLTDKPVMRAGTCAGDVVGWITTKVVGGDIFNINIGAFETASSLINGSCCHLTQVRKEGRLFDYCSDKITKGEGTWQVAACITSLVDPDNRLTAEKNMDFLFPSVNDTLGAGAYLVQMTVMSMREGIDTGEHAIGLYKDEDGSWEIFDSNLGINKGKGSQPLVLAMNDLYGKYLEEAGRRLVSCNVKKLNIGKELISEIASMYRIAPPIEDKPREAKPIQLPAEKAIELLKGKGVIVDEELQTMVHANVVTIGHNLTLDWLVTNMKIDARKALTILGTMEEQDREYGWLNKPDLAQYTGALVTSTSSPLSSPPAIPQSRQLSQKEEYVWIVMEPHVKGSDQEEAKQMIAQAVDGFGDDEKKKAEFLDKLEANIFSSVAAKQSHDPGLSSQNVSVTIQELGQLIGTTAQLLFALTTKTVAAISSEAPQANPPSQSPKPPPPP